MKRVVSFYLDWDIGFRDWNRRVRNASFGLRSRGWMRNKLRILTRSKVRADYRRSGGRHIHILLTWRNPISFEESICWRAVLRDDPARIRADAERFKKDVPTDRCFDTKHRNGKTGHASEWKRWF